MRSRYNHETRRDVLGLLFKTHYLGLPGDYVLRFVGTLPARPGVLDIEPR